MAQLPAPKFMHPSSWRFMDGLFLVRVAGHNKVKIILIYTLNWVKQYEWQCKARNEFRHRLSIVFQFGNRRTGNKQKMLLLNRTKKRTRILVSLTQTKAHLIKSAARNGIGIISVAISKRTLEFHSFCRRRHLLTYKKKTRNKY